MDASPSTHEVTRLLGELNRGDRHALDSLMPLVYDELRRIAGRHLQRERLEHTLQPTALVHEAFMRMVDQSSCHWQSRLHFLSVAATMMRRVLIDHAKARFRTKRGGPGQQRLSIDDLNIAVEERAVEVIAIDEALKKLNVILVASTLCMETGACSESVGRTSRTVTFGGNSAP